MGPYKYVISEVETIKIKMAFNHPYSHPCAFRQDLPAAPWNMPANFVYPPEEAFRYTNSVVSRPWNIWENSYGETVYWNVFDKKNELIYNIKNLNNCREIEDLVPNVWRCGFCNHIEGKYNQQPKGVTSDGEYFICFHCLTFKKNGNTMVVERNTSRVDCSDHPQCVVKNEMYGILVKINSSYQRQWSTIFLKYIDAIPNSGSIEDGVSNWNSESETGKKTLVKNIIDRIEEEKQRKIRKEEEERQRRIRQEEEERQRKIQKEKEEKKKRLYNSVIDKHVNIEYVKQHYEINRKSQGTFNCIQATITILQIGGVAVIYFNYSYSFFILLGVFCLDYVEIKQIEERAINKLNHYNNSASRKLAIDHYGKLEDTDEDMLNKQLDNLAKPKKTAMQIIDRSKEQLNIVFFFRERYYSISWFIALIFYGCLFAFADLYLVQQKKCTGSGAKCLHEESEVAFKLTIFVIGTLFIVLKLFVQHIVIECCYNPKIDLSPLFVREPSERQRLLTSMEV